MKFPQKFKVKGLVAELTPPNVQSAWGFREEKVRTTGLAVCCNYLKKKKKATKDPYF